MLSVKYMTLNNVYLDRLFLSGALDTADASKFRNSVGHFLTHLSGTDRRLACSGKVRSAVPAFENPSYRPLDAGRLPFQAERISQQQGARENGTQRVGNAASGDIRCRAMDRLVEPNGPANARRRQ